MRPVPPHCPACGYDLRGVVGERARDLDREVVCSECGRVSRVGETIAYGVQSVRIRGCLAVLMLVSLLLLALGLLRYLVWLL